MKSSSVSTLSNSISDSEISLIRPTELLRPVFQITGSVFDSFRNPIFRSALKSTCAFPSDTYRCATTDLFWTFTDSAYNTIFKILFIGSSTYTIYLMLNDYKPTHDPNIDTFKVQYLLGFSALLAILFPEKYSVSEVSFR